HRLIHSQGNFGSIAGLPPAAMRYTEARLSNIAADMIADLERDTVDFTDNYDGKYREQLVLPGKFPNLLVNGSDGTAEGSSTQIIINEVPFQQTRNRLAEAIGDLVKDERVKGISAMRDESSARTGEPVRIVLDIKREADPQLVLNQLYQFSPLQRTTSIILLALVDGRPRTLTLKQMLEEFLRHRVRVIRRRTEYLLREAKRRSHVLGGQLIAISSLDEVIAICRQSPSRAEAKQRLQDLAVAAAVLKRALGEDHFLALQREIGVHESYRMTEAQTEAVVRMQL